MASAIAAFDRSSHKPIIHSLPEGGALSPALFMAVRREIVEHDVPREAYLVIRAGLTRLARKAGLVESFIFVSSACRARLACLAHNSRVTKARRSSGSAIAAVALMHDAG